MTYLWKKNQKTDHLPGQSMEYANKKRRYDGCLEEIENKQITECHRTVWNCENGRYENGCQVI